MDSPPLSTADIAANLKRIRKSKKVNQKQLAKMIDKSERTIQNYEAGKTEFTMAILREIAEALDVDFRRFLAPPGQNIKKPQGIDLRNSWRNQYSASTLADLVNMLFRMQETYDISMEIDVKKPPEDKKWKASIAIDGKGGAKFDADFCLFLENWKQKLDLLYSSKLSIDKYRTWQDETISYYSDSMLTPELERPDVRQIGVTEDGIERYEWVNPKEPH